MDWQDSGASPLKPLTDEQLAEALLGLDTEAAMRLLEQQAELRRRQAELDEVLRQRQALLDAEQKIEEQVTSEPEAVENVPDFDAVINPVVQEASEPEDIAASLNALYGAGSPEVANPVSQTVASAEEQVSELEESAVKADNLVDDLILQFGGENDDETSPVAAETRVKAKQTRAEGRSAWSLIANWNGSGALVIAMLLGYTFAGEGHSIGSLAAGGFVAFVVLGLAFAFSALAARRGNAYQQILSRAAFGVSGNIIPAATLLIARILAVSVALVCGSLAIAVLLPNLKLSSGYTVSISGVGIPAPLLVLAGLVLLVTALSWFRRRALEIARIIITVTTLALIGSIFAIAELQQRVAYRSDFTVELFPALALASSLVVVFGLLFSITSADENRRIRATTVVPKFLAAGLLNWLIAGTAALAAGFALATLDLTTATLLPVSVTIVILGVFGLATIIAQTSNQLVGLRAPEPKLLVRLGLSLLVLGIAVWFYVSFNPDEIWASLWQLLPVAGVPVAAWLGIFCSDVMLRRTDYHLVSLDKNYGFYRGWNLINLLGWLVASAAGLGLIKSAAPMLEWTGYLATLLSLDDRLMIANLGIWVALVLGALLPICFGIPRIRRQETETRAIEARRSELLDVVGEYQL